ncbi:helix-turn-helix domain-containing protein [Alcanivorax limicola]|uniref:helix-turn-helix domain-containing protein n=1 Tax=Alcanivorax limicola TaxID=2874102 RepID=UPI001CBC3380|nr:helix-turn-helix transcriptional regulator [Alcanivorax limicola]
MVRHRGASHNRAMDIGEVLKRRRENRMETLEDVAFRAGTDASNLSRIERGLQQPSLSLLDGLAVALETRVSDIYTELEAARNLPASKTPKPEPWAADLQRLQRHVRELDADKRAMLVDIAKLLKRH